MRILIIILALCTTALAAHAQLPFDIPDSTATLGMDTPFLLQTFTPPSMGPEYVPDAIPQRTNLVIDDKFIRPRTNNSPQAWLFIIFLLQLFLLVVIRLVFDKDFFAQLRAFFNVNLSQQLQREIENSIPFSTLLLNVNGFISLAMLAYLLLVRQFGLNVTALNDGQLFVIILVATSILHMLKYLLMRGSAFIFPIVPEMNLYNFNFFLNHQLLGILLIPLNMIIAYAPADTPAVVSIIALSVACISFIMLTIKGLGIGRSYFRLYKFHFIIYICTLEIAPILVLYKVFTRIL